MKNFLILFSTIFAVINQSYAADATGEVKARVVGSISVSQTTALNFGSFSASSALGTINQAGTATGGVTAVSGGETRTAATFLVAGDSAGPTPYTFTLPATTTIRTGANQMLVTLSERSSSSSGSLSRTLTSGSDSVIIDGVLDVAANQATGSYTGTYEVTANY